MSKRHHIVIVGAGFGGLAVAQGLGNRDVDVTVIDRQNHHLFQPLLYQVATAGLSPADIAAPIRSIVRHFPNVRVMLDRVSGVDQDAKHVVLQSGNTVKYDYLVIATGARHSYFGHNEWAAFAPGLKTIDDATALRRKVLLSLERAEIATDPQQRKALLTYVVVGGGPTGVEMAGAIAELARCSVRRDFRSITPHCSRVILIEAGPRLLQSFPEDLSLKAQVSLEQLGVEVQLGTQVEAIQSDGVATKTDYIRAYTTVWAAGVQASDASRWLKITPDRTGRVPVGPDLRIADDPAVFVIGDTACCIDEEGLPLPGVAPVAKQQGAYVARMILSGLESRPSKMTAAKPFAYRNYGNLATIGRNRAVADFGKLKISGHLAWLMWCVIHIWFLTGHRNRITVGANWLWSYLTFTRSARLITGDTTGEGAASLPHNIVPPCKTDSIIRMLS